MANWSQKKLLLTIGGSALFVCATAAGGVYYTQGLIDEVDAKIEPRRPARSTAADQKIAKMPRLEKEVIILRENLDEYVKILPDTRELNAFVRMLNQFERQSGIRGTGLVPKNKTAKKGSGRFTSIVYTYEMTATLWQGLKFMNLIENFERFVSINEFSITTGGTGRGEETRDGEVVHTIKLTMQTYTYNKGGKGAEVEIPNYSDRREELREEIWKRMQAIRIDRYEHRGIQGRRDIFVDPRERGDVRADGPSPAEQRAVLDKYVSKIAGLNEILKQMRAEDTTLFLQYTLEKSFRTKLGELLGQIEADEGRVTYAPYRLRWSKEVLEPIEQLQSQLDSQVAVKTEREDPYLPREAMEQLVADMQTDCNNGQLEQAKERYEAVRDRLGVPADDPRHELAVLAKSWQVKASTAIDFKGLDLQVQGVVVSQAGTSGVLLNGEVFEEGDYVADDLLIKLVEAEQVWFVFRGLTLVRTM